VKQRFFSLGVGLLILAAVFGFTVAGQFSPAITLILSDARLFYTLGAILIFCGGFLLGAKGHFGIWDAVLLYLPLGGAFVLTTLRDLPFMWPILPLWILSGVIGARLASPARNQRLWLIDGSGLLLVASLWYCGRYLTKRMEAVSSHVRNYAGPAVTFQPVGEQRAPLHPTPGKILVVDFAQTWCMPCLAELPQIAGVREDLRDRKDIEFVLVATDAGGDTPTQFRAFVERRHIALPLAVDPGGKAHAAFGVHGFPSLVVVDKSGRVRFTHEGYNSSETDFRHNLVELLNTL
jgi:peroxiredoxin